MKQGNAWRFLPFRPVDLRGSTKKLSNKVAADVDVAVVSVCQAPGAGERKKGDLSDLWVHKFKSQGQLYLLGYTLNKNVRLVYLEAIGPHENFYRDLKRS